MDKQTKTILWIGLGIITISGMAYLLINRVRKRPKRIGEKSVIREDEYIKPQGSIDKDVYEEEEKSKMERWCDEQEGGWFDEECEELGY
jgi:hypothetical protein